MMKPQLIYSVISVRLEQLLDWCQSLARVINGHDLTNTMTIVINTHIILYTKYMSRPMESFWQMTGKKEGPTNMHTQLIMYRSGITTLNLVSPSKSRISISLLIYYENLTFACLTTKFEFWGNQICLIFYSFPQYPIYYFIAHVAYFLYFITVSYYYLRNDPSLVDLIDIIFIDSQIKVTMATALTFRPILLLALILAFAQSWSPQAEKDRVQQLDGYMNFTGKFQMFSGYLELQQNPRINVHYLFVTSFNKPAKDDVVLWLNGGPGCSSLLGFSQQLGPNMMYSGSKSFANYWNPYSWNQNANLLFFESPPGVGFSINKDQSYVYNESRTAADNVAAIKAFFNRFPELLSNNFWITGESYCGMYIPNFASALIDANQVATVGDTKINFKGVMIGNGVMVTNKNWRRQARNKFYSKHYHYGTEINNLIKYCNYNDSDIYNPSCIKGNQLADQSVVGVNPYATIGVCYTPTSITKGRKRFYYTPFFQQNNPIIGEDSLSAGNYTPCTDDSGMERFFNQQKVKEQLHVDTTITWKSCNENIGDTYHKDAASTQIFQKLKQHKLKILLYSGNTDAVVSYVETIEYIKQIGWKELTHQKPFDNDRDSLMGWWTQYDGLTLAVINGAGHMVPSDKPHAAYEMFSEFLSRP